MAVNDQIKPLVYLDFLQLHKLARAQGILKKDRKVLDSSQRNDTRRGYIATVNRLFRACLEHIFTDEFFKIEKLRAHNHTFIIKCAGERSVRFRDDIKAGIEQYLRFDLDDSEKEVIANALAKRNIETGSLLFEESDSRRIGNWTYAQLRPITNGYGNINDRLTPEFTRPNGFLKIDAQEYLGDNRNIRVPNTFETYKELRSFRTLLSAFGEIGRNIRGQTEVAETPAIQTTNTTNDIAITPPSSSNTITVSLDPATGDVTVNSDNGEVPPAWIPLSSDVEEPNPTDVENVRQRLFGAMPEFERPPLDDQIRWARQNIISDSRRRRLGR